MFSGKRFVFGMPELPHSGKYSNDSLPLQPVGLKQIQSVTIKAGELKVVFVDNSALPPDHKKGYNGIAELYHDKQDSNVFVPAFSGINLEHIFNGESPISLFEPRKDLMYLYRKSETEVLLYQKPTTYSSVESLMEFRVIEPDYIDFTFHFVFHDESYFKHGFAGIFFASYMNQPPDKKIYFLGKKDGEPGYYASKKIPGYSEKHGYKSTHRFMQDNRELYFSPDFTVTLANHFSDFRYTRSFFYGRFHNMALAFFFDPSDFIRFSQSPDGAGQGNPAWDFYYITPSPQKGKQYSIKGRILYRPYKKIKEIVREYEKWRKTR